MRAKQVPLLLLFLLLTVTANIGCQRQTPVSIVAQEDTVALQSYSVADTVVVPPRKSATALRFDSLGLVNVQELDSTIAVSLVYATSNNFTGHVLYADLKEAYLHPEAAQRLVEAQRLLRSAYPQYTLLILDATRPFSVQRQMWELVKGTPKYIYVSNPSRGGGLHNYGLAVDLTLADEYGHTLPMGTPFDYFGVEAHTTDEARLVREGKLTEQEKVNREILREAMTGAGFRALPTEWWHFHLHGREVAKARYQLIE